MVRDDSSSALLAVTSLPVVSTAKFWVLRFGFVRWRVPLGVRRDRPVFPSEIAASAVASFVSVNNASPSSDGAGTLLDRRPFVSLLVLRVVAVRRRTLVTRLPDREAVFFSADEVVSTFTSSP